MPAYGANTGLPIGELIRLAQRFPKAGAHLSVKWRQYRGAEGAGRGPGELLLIPEPAPNLPA